MQWFWFCVPPLSPCLPLSHLLPHYILHNPNEGRRTAISANWVEDTQAQLGAMMATVPHCHRQPFFIEQSEAILAGPRDATHLPTWRYFLSTRPQGLHLLHKARLSTRHQGTAFSLQWIHQLNRFPACFSPVILRPWVKVRPEKKPIEKNPRVG